MSTPTTDLDRFIAAYIECALWSSIEGENDVPMDRNYGPDDIAPSSLESVRLDCAQFAQEQAAILDYCESAGEHGDTYAAAGRDFWLTRNGHGAGFWDGDWNIGLPPLETCDQKAGDVLTDAAHKFGECDLYVGDDGKVYVSPERKGATS